MRTHRTDRGHGDLAPYTLRGGRTGWVHNEQTQNRLRTIDAYTCPGREYEEPATCSLHAGRTQWFAIHDSAYILTYLVC